MRRTWPLLTIAAACTLALGACSKQAEKNAVAPGRPGTGNGVEVVQPALPSDAPPGGVKGSVPYPGAARAAVGADAAASQSAPVGTGLDGGLGTRAAGNAGSTAPAAASGGSPNTTTDSSFGNRP